MNKIITISREFGSGGRELGKRLAEGLHTSTIAHRFMSMDSTLQQSKVNQCKERAAYREMYTDDKWGNKMSYHLCINTSYKEIKLLIPGIVEYVNCWFG